MTEALARMVTEEEQQEHYRQQHREKSQNQRIVFAEQVLLGLLNVPMKGVEPGSAQFVDGLTQTAVSIVDALYGKLGHLT